MIVRGGTADPRRPALQRKFELRCLCAKVASLREARQTVERQASLLSTADQRVVNT